MFKFLPDSQFVALWLSKWLELKSSLGQDAANSFAWRWTLRLKILAFMMARYGTIAANPRQTRQQFSLTTYVNPPFHSKLVQSGSSIRMALARIAEQNKYKLPLGAI